VVSVVQGTCLGLQPFVAVRDGVKTPFSPQCVSIADFLHPPFMRLLPGTFALTVAQAEQEIDAKLASSVYRVLAPALPAALASIACKRLLCAQLVLLGSMGPLQGWQPPRARGPALREGELGRGRGAHRLWKRFSPFLFLVTMRFKTTLHVYDAVS
jgi:hypothetical protein